MSDTGFNDEILRNQLIQSTGKELEQVASSSIDSTSNQLLIIKQSLADFEHVSLEIKSMKQSSTDITNKIDHVSISTDESSKKLIDVVSKMKDLEEDVKNINGLVKVINTIAEQTNLLALNATIEAARAGDAGKGFAVVASEVKELSQTTKTANEKIQVTLHKIAESTAVLSGSVETTANNMTESFEMVKDAKNTVSILDQKTDNFLEITNQLTINFQNLGHSSQKVESEVNELKTIGQTISSLITVMKVQGLFKENFCPLERLGPIVEASNFNNPTRFTTIEPEYILKEDDVLISATDLRGVITFANETFYTAAEYEFGSLIGKPHNIIRHKDMPKAAFADLWDVIKGGNLWQGYVVNKGRSGRIYWVKANVFPTYTDGKISGYISVRTKPSKDKIEIAKAAYRLVE